MKILKQALYVILAVLICTISLPMKNATVNASTTYSVGYVYPSKSSSSNKYNNSVSFKSLNSYTSFDSAYSKMKSYYSSYMNSYNKTKSSSYKEKAYGMCVKNSSGKIIAMSIGRAYASSSGSTLTVDNTYVSNDDELFYFGNTSATSAKIGVSGAVGYVNPSNLILVPRVIILYTYQSGTSSTHKYRTAYYSKNSSGDLVHTIANLSDPSRSKYFESNEQTWLTSFTVDKAPSFMKTGTRYYSMDGINYYTDSNLSSSSKVGTYYPYYTYLPYRTKTAYSASNLNSHINTYSKSSKLRSQGSNLIEAQNTYGINALLELSFANLESAYGTSWYALNRNNLFGIAAYDSNPDNAYSFSSAGTCIKEHAYRHLSRGYFDTDTDSRYFGTCPGNKKVGVNVKYASDPYHGEKIGGIAYKADKEMGKKDYGRYTIGVTKTACYIYKSASTSSTKLYKLATKFTSTPVGMSVAIIGTSGNYYKVQTDAGMVNGDCNYANKYNFSSSVGYIPKSNITIIRKGTSDISSESSSSGSTSTSKPNLDLSNIKIYPSTSYGFTPGALNSFRVDIYSKTNKSNTKVQLKVYTSSGKSVATLSKTINQSGTVKFYWNGKATSGNSAKYSTSSYVPRTSSGTTYKFKVTISSGSTSTSSYTRSFKIYSKATKLSTDINDTSIKYGQKSILSMKPNRPGTSRIYVYNSSGKIVAKYTFYYRKANTKLSASFKGYATSGNNAGYKAGSKLKKGKYKVKFRSGDYIYSYPKTITLK